MDILVALIAEDDEELAIFDDILNTKNRVYHHLKKKTGVFRLDDLDDNFCFTHFRFYKSDIRKLRILFNIPDEIVLETRIKVSGEEAFCILLRRLAYPNRYVDLMQYFPRGKSALSAIFNAMVHHILYTKGYVLKRLNAMWLSPVYLRTYCQSLTEKGSPYTRCFGFLDGTIRANCRPRYNQRQFYNGHKRVHALKFQSLILPNGIIANLFGPVNGRRHDAHVLAKSGLINKLDQKFHRFQSPPYIYSDTGYPLKKCLMVPFKGTITRSQKKCNTIMSGLRVSVEWGFGKEIGNYYKIGVILTNCHTCLYGGQVSDYFECEQPLLEDYLN